MAGDIELVEIRLRLRNTFSFWAAVLGAALAVPKQTRRLGAILLMLVGYGGVGVAWERAYQCDLRRVRDSHLPQRSLTGMMSHAPFAVAGTLLWRSRR